MCGQSTFISFQCCHLFATYWEIPLTYMYMCRLNQQKLGKNLCVRQSCHVPFSRFFAYSPTTGLKQTEVQLMFIVNQINLQNFATALLHIQVQF